MKRLKIKFVLVISSFLFFFGFIFSITLFFSDNADDQQNIDVAGLSLSKEVLSHKSIVEKYCKEFNISKYSQYILAIMQVESGGKGKDVMQSSESLGLPPNSLSTQDSIKQGCKYFSELLKSAKSLECDISSVVQSYNYGGGFLQYVHLHGKKYSYNIAENFSKEKSGGTKVAYPNPIAIPINGGWRYNYGNQFYVNLVSQYLSVVEFDDKVVQSIMNEALKYQGYPYVFGGSNPDTSFDCSGLTQWCFNITGISLPRTAQAQYNVTQHIPLSNSKPGDLVFFHSTYDTSDYVTHIGILVSPTKMYHAGDPIGYADLTEDYWQQHLIGAGRIINK